MALTVPEHETDLCEQLRRPTFYAIILTNDLFSWEKERAEAAKDANTPLVNAIWVLMREHSITEPEAQELCREKIKECVAESVRVFEDTKRDLDISLELRQYVEAQQYALSGNLVWSIHCPRYNPEVSLNDDQYAMMKEMTACQALH